MFNSIQSRLIFEKKETKIPGNIQLSKMLRIRARNFQLTKKSTMKREKSRYLNLGQNKNVGVQYN